MIVFFHKLENNYFDPKDRKRSAKTILGNQETTLKFKHSHLSCKDRIIYWSPAVGWVVDWKTPRIPDTMGIIDMETSHVMDSLRSVAMFQTGLNVKA